MTKATDTTTLRRTVINSKRGYGVMSSVKRKLELGLLEIAPNKLKGYTDKGKKGFLKQIENLQKQLNRRWKWN